MSKFCVRTILVIELGQVSNLAQVLMTNLIDLTRIQDAIGSAVDRLWVRVRFRSVKRKLFELGWSDFSSRYAGSDTGYLKYLEIDRYLRRDLRRAYEARRHIGGQRGAILDLGTGMSLFPFCCGVLGMRCVGVEPYNPDWDYAEMFRESALLLGVQTIDHMIRPFESIPLPSDVVHVAAITANQIQFNKIGRDDAEPEVLASERFGPAEWDFLLRDLLRQAPDSEPFLKLSFNRPVSWLAPYTDDLRDYFEGLGATCRGSIVRIPRLRL